MWNNFCLKPQPLLRSLRRYYYQYKPKDKNITNQKTLHRTDSEKAEKFASTDILLFRYENPRRIMLYNLGSVTVFTMFSYQAWTAWKLKSDLAPYKDQFNKEYEEKSYIFRHIDLANRGVAIGFFAFGAGCAFYWLVRTLYLVRRLVLRKGGRHVTIVTYGLLGATSKNTTVPLSHCSGHSRPLDATERFFLKVRDHPKKFEFNLKDGVFGNRPLFNKTVGISRRVLD